MSQKAKSSKMIQLLDARRQDREQLLEGSLRPHGKLWAMDVFSWCNPKPEQVATTIESFPFPIVWIGNANMFEWCKEDHSEMWSNVNAIISIDKSNIALSADNFTEVSTIMGAANIDDALIMLKAAKKQNAVLLFTASCEEWERNYTAFKSFIDLHQVK